MRGSCSVRGHRGDALCSARCATRRDAVERSRVGALVRDAPTVHAAAQQQRCFEGGNSCARISAPRPAHLMAACMKRTDAALSASSPGRSRRADTGSEGASGTLSLSDSTRRARRRLLRATIPEIRCLLAWPAHTADRTEHPSGPGGRVRLRRLSAGRNGRNDGAQRLCSGRAQGASGLRPGQAGARGGRSVGPVRSLGLRRLRCGHQAGRYNGQGRWGRTAVLFGCAEPGLRERVDQLCAELAAALHRLRHGELQDRACSSTQVHTCLGDAFTMS